MPTKIQWTDETWNPVTGCTPVSAGCDHCYARRMATRLRGRYGYPQDDPFKVTLHPDRLDQPLKWRKPRMIFCCSMGDFFHPQVPLEFQARMLNVMVKCPQHIFIILTKRHKQLAIFNEVCGWSAEAYPNVWPGVSIEDQPTADERIPILLQMQAAVRVVSIEPMLGAISLHYTYTPKWTDVTGKCRSRTMFPPIHWVICGGETGPGARPMNPEWARAVNKQCVEAGVPFFFKQRGPWIPDPLADPAEPYVRTVDGLRMSQTSWKRQPIVAAIASRLLDGKEWNEIPERR